jgi:hypothetical protein
VLTELWTGLGGKLSERLAAVLLSPALGFWLVGAAAWVLHRGGGPEDWVTVADDRAGRLADLSGAGQLVVAAIALAVLVVGGRVVDSLALPTLRLLEGYWPAPLAAPRRWLSGRSFARREATARRWRELQPVDELTPTEAAEAVRLDRRLRRMPMLAAQAMPTRLGNVLRASETRPVRKYGLDPVICWPQLWLLLPDPARAEVSAARGRLNSAAATVLWGVLLLVWTVWTWWAVPVALLVVVAGYVAAVRAAGAYGDLVEAAWDLYRTELYRALRWPLPADPVGEYDAGRAVTAYLRRGSRGHSPTFT